MSGSGFFKKTSADKISTKANEVAQFAINKIEENMEELEEKLQKSGLFTQEEIDKIVVEAADKALQNLLNNMPENLRKAYKETQEEKSQNSGNKFTGGVGV